MSKRKLADATIKKLSYEQAIEQLESILDDVESGEAGLEEALDHCEDGAKILAHCRAILDRVEKRVEKLTLDAKGGSSNAKDEEADDGDDDGGDATVPF